MGPFLILSKRHADVDLDAPHLIFHLSRKELRSVVSIHLADERVVVESFLGPARWLSELLIVRASLLAAIDSVARAP